ncbi:MAG: bifunctional riboflavin kinase/FAD synthetase [Chitinophagaceae bacterium]|jgi:riboflavin kinase/FMN adenylyltransferase|nr:bifunctional riboflavin kinase/FAD synthetase [Chitinophagaceae bacterium]
MQVHKNLDKLPEFRNAVVTIGTFDGVHMGHRLIIAQLLEEARRIDGESVIITFHPHPRKVVGNQQSEIRLLNTLAEKIQLLEKLGINHLVVVPFTEEFGNQHAIDYVEKFLVARFHPAVIIIGYDHHFGKNREGNYQLLEALRDRFSYQLVEIPERVLHDITVSSTRVRTALFNSDVETANEFLGYDYFFEGTVVMGNRLGRTLGFPTANLRIVDSEKLIPGNGVYAVRAFLPQHPDAIWLLGMMNIGVRPTVDGTRQTVEVNLFDFDEEIYGQTLRVEVVRHLRGEKKFDGLESLKQQLARDRENALQVLQFPKD